MRFRHEIQGLRGLAVIAVLLFHANMRFSRGSVIALDVFLVLSGFLVFSNMRAALADNRFSLAEFLRKRIIRLYPAFLAVLVLVLAVAVLLMFPEDFVTFNRSFRYALAQLANVYFWRNTGYFAMEAQLTPLLHFWSIAFEWQFSILFPLLVLGLRRLGGHWLPRGLAALCLVGFLMSLYVFTDQMTAYYLLPFRGWEMLLGALAAYVDVGRIKQRWVDVGYWAGILLLAVPYCLYGHGRLADMAYPGPAALPPCIGTLCIVLFHERASARWVKKALEWKPLVFLGGVSYSIYLIHWPIMVFIRYYLLAIMERVSLGVETFAMLLSVVMGVFLHYAVEKPALRLRPKLWMCVVGVAAVSLALLGGAKLASNRDKVLLDTDPTVRRDQGFFGENPWRLSTPDGRGFFAHKLGGYPDDPDRVDFLIMGDSQANMWGRTLDEQCAKRGLRGLAVSGGNILFGVYREVDASADAAAATQEALRLALSRYRVKCAVIAIGWSVYADAEMDYPFHRLNGVEGGTRMEVLEWGLGNTLAVLRGAGVERVFFVRPIPILEIDPFRTRYFAKKFGLDLRIADKGPTVAAYDDYNRATDAMLRRHVPGNDFLEAPARLLALSAYADRYPVVYEDELLYADTSHLTKACTDLLADMFDPLFEACGPHPAPETETEAP